VQAYRQQYGPEEVKSMKRMRVNTPFTYFISCKDQYSA